MASETLWNIRGQEWLDSLEDIASNATEDPDSKLTQFEKNLTADLKQMIEDEPEDGPELIESITRIAARIESYRQQAHSFFVAQLNENDWSISNTPIVDIRKDGAFVQMWRWFRAPCDQCDANVDLADGLCEKCAKKGD